MYSYAFKLNRMKRFYDNVSMKDVDSQCPFGKNFVSVEDNEVLRKMDCLDLCGTWVELGDVRRGCPCHTLGKDVAMAQVYKILKREGFINE